MARAFATLEGIGLSSDKDYAILSECFPYLVSRCGGSSLHMPPLPPLIIS